MLNKFIDNLNKHIQDNFWLYTVSFFCICIGIVFGIYSVKYMDNFSKSDLTNYVLSFIKSKSLNNINYKEVFLGTLKNNLPIIIGIWFLGLTIIGIPFILIIDVIKGFTLGFTFSFFISALGGKGIGVALGGVLPQNIIYIPCIIFCSVISMKLSLTIIKDSKNWKRNIITTIGSYSVIFIIVSLVMCIGFLIEVFITPEILNLAAFIYGSAFI